MLGHRASELAGSSLVKKNENPEGELTGEENLNELKTCLHQILTEIQEFNTGSSSDDVNLQECICWLTSLNQFIAKILQHFPLTEAEQSNIQSYDATLNKMSNALRQKLLSFAETQPSLFKSNPADLATANRLDPGGKYIDLKAVAELNRPNFWLDIKHRIEKIAEQLIIIMEKKSNTSPEQSQVESGPSDQELQQELERFNQDLKKINEEADREILVGIVNSFFKHTIKYTVSVVGGVETKRLTIIELVFTLLDEIQTSEEDKEDEKIAKIVEKVKGNPRLYSELKNYFIKIRIPISSSIKEGNIEKYKKLFLQLCGLNGLEGKKVKITLRDTSKLYYLKALLPKINDQELGILDILRGRFRNLGHELNINYFRNALLFLIKIIETDETTIKTKIKIKEGVVSFGAKKMRRRRVKMSREPTYPDTTDTTDTEDTKDTKDTITTMIVTEAQGRNRNPNDYKFTSYPQHMLSLFDIGEISLVGK